MSLTELLPALHDLKRADKLRLLQFLVLELAREEGVTLLEAGKDYPIWTPLNSFGAANTLMNALTSSKNSSRA